MRESGSVFRFFFLRSERWPDGHTETAALGVPQQEQARAKLTGAEPVCCNGERDKNLQ